MPVAIGLVAITIAHLPLLIDQPDSRRLEGIENVLFETTGASPALVLICWLWFLYQRLPRLRGFEGQESPVAGVLFLCLGASLCVWAHYVAAPTLLVLSLSLISLASGLLLGGVGALRTLLFPSVFLLLAMPIPTPVVNLIIYPLQLANGAAAGFVLSVFGFEPIVSADLVLVGEQLFQVIESCSGLRTIVTVVMGACVYSQLAWHDQRRTTALIVLSPFVGLLANHLRILTIILNPYSSIATVHTAQGLVMIVFAMLLIAMIDSLLARVWKTTPEPHLLAETATGRLPLVIGGSYAVICMSIAVASLSVTPWSPPEEEIVPLERIQADLPEWRVKGFQPNTEFLGTVSYDEFIAHSYTLGRLGDGPPVELFVAMNRHLDPRLGLGSAKTLIPGPGGVLIFIESGPDAVRPNVDVAIVRMATGDQLVYHWKIGLSSWWWEATRAVLALDRSPFRRAHPSAFVRISTPIDSGLAGRANATARLGTLMNALREDFIEVGVWP